MRFLMINLFFVCLFLFGISYLAFGHDGTDTTSEPHAHHVSEASWDAALGTFYKLLKTDPEAARVELQSVAKELFNEHPRTEEWVELFYQVFYQISLKETEQNGTGYPSALISDLIGVFELGLEMLTDMDTEKYAEQIQFHREALEYYTALATELAGFAEAIGDKSLRSEEVPPDAQESVSQSAPELSDAEKEEPMARPHMEKFYELVSTDPEVARKELDTYAAMLYQGHPLKEEWVELMFRIGSEGEATISDITRLLEMSKRIRTDMDPEKYAKEIRGFTDSLEQLKLMAKFYERDGMTDAKIPFSISSADKKNDNKRKPKGASGVSKVSHREKIGKSAPDFQVIDLKGQELSLKKFRGQVVLLDFWATWCIPCRTEMPHLKKIYDKYKDQKFEIIGISLDHGRAVLDSYIEKKNITWPQFLDDGSVAKMYNVTGIPATFLLDGEGIVRRVQLRGSALEEAVAELVKENLTKQAK